MLNVFHFPNVYFPIVHFLIVHFPNRCFPIVIFEMSCHQCENLIINKHLYSNADLKRTVVFTLVIHAFMKPETVSYIEQ